MRVAIKLYQIYEALFSAYGPQYWWPGETPFEVMVGAVLTQNTNWSNVERALKTLLAMGHLNPLAIAAADPLILGAWLRPTGYYNVKTQRLQSFCRWYLARGEQEQLAKIPTVELRRELLALNGIGPETADDILLYAFNRPVFVIDTYTRRLFTRLGMIEGNESYEMLRTIFAKALGVDVALYNEYHALIIFHAQGICHKRQPACDSCILEWVCKKCTNAISGRSGNKGRS